MARSANSVRAGSGRLGTFGGVFTPSILTILGIILFLRLGYVVGTAGLRGALGILALATAISVLTSISLAAIATNRRVRGGGDYYVISRTLGISYGGALGLLLFLAQTISAAFYCIGFAEALGAFAPFATIPPHVAAGTLALVLLAVSWIGADLATRFQYVIMAALAAGLASFFAGGFVAFDGTRLERAWYDASEPGSFWIAFAIFFPAVTGFTQGVSRSGDLRDPARSLPAGTFAAVALSTVVYLSAMLVLSGSLPTDTLRSDYTAMGRVASVPALVDAGVIAATASSALASLLGAPRILQALARDGIFSTLAPFAAGSSKSDNPRRATLLTGAIALATIAAGSLNVIAAVVSMFFLISYGLLNYATYVEATAASPSFRPRFRFFHARASMAGGVLCLGAMLAIEPVAAVVAIAILGAIHQYLDRTAIPARWRDSRYAYRFRRVKEGLRDLSAEPEGSRDWQPNVLVFTDDPERRDRLLRFAAFVTGGSGLIGAVQLVEGDPTLASTRERTLEAEQGLAAELRDRDLDAFALAIAAPDLRSGASSVVQAWGIGPVRANTVLLNWLSGAGDAARPLSDALQYGRILRSAIQLGRNVLVLDADEERWQRIDRTPAESRRIDVWWWGGDSSRLALLLAYLCTRTDPWRDASIQLFAPTSAGQEQKIEANLLRRLEEMRIEAAVTAVDDSGPDALERRSADATLALLPFHISGMRIVDGFGRPFEAIAERLPATCLVAASGDVQIGTEALEEAVDAPEAATSGQAPDREDAR